jgi:hypothetical protein
LGGGNQWGRLCGWGDYGAQAYEQSRTGAAGAGEANGTSDINDGKKLYFRNVEQKE